MITIEGQDFYNFAEALLYLFSIVGDNYSKEEIDEMITAISIARITATGIAMQNAMSFLLTVL